MLALVLVLFLVEERSEGPEIRGPAAVAGASHCQLSTKWVRRTQQ